MRYNLWQILPLANTVLSIATVAMLAVIVTRPAPVYTLEATNELTGQTHVMDFDLSATDCFYRAAEEATRWGTNIRWECQGA